MKILILCGLLCAALCLLFLTAEPILALAVAIICLVGWGASRGIRLVAVAFSPLASSILPASAATGDSIVNALLPHAPEILNSIVIPFVIWAAVQVARKAGVEIQEKHKRTLQSALTTGANLALQHKLTGAAAIGVILDHVLNKGAPDAVATRAMRSAGTLALRPRRGPGDYDRLGRRPL